uniref:DUF5641 domain-containing protein n=1 Tax=Amphimedon queenslandica TaxID=400682 RepID=A0A1X7T1D0_AMPQE
MGADGNARGSVVRLLSRGKQTTLLKHPVQKLIPLEVEESPEIEESPDIERTDPTVDTSKEKEEDDCERTVIEDGNCKSTRPRRIAAVEARDNILARLCES